MKDDKQEWRLKAKSLLRSEMARRNINYVNLAKKLQEMGLNYTSTNLSNKVARGSFSTAFFLQCLDAIDCREIRVADNK